VVVGAASRDLTADDPRGWRLGGSGTYVSLAAARLGLEVGCVLGIDEPAADASELELLKEAGVRLRRVALGHGPVFENVERDGHRRQRWTSESDPIPVASLPGGWERSRGWVLGPVAGEVGEDWAEVPSAGTAVCLGWQGLLRDFAPDGWVVRVATRSSALLSRAGLVCASLDDLPRDASIDGLRGLSPRASLVLTDGERGGLAISPGHDGATGPEWQHRMYRYRAILARSVDPTGAGDVFMAALTAAWLSTGELATPRALRLAAAAGSCAVEAPGLAGVPTRDQVLARLGDGLQGGVGESAPDGGAGGKPA
jgi:sugar/nucleoside kinase (ribokinase family)